MLKRVSERINAEQFLNIINAIVFIAALIYFSTFAAPRPVVQGEKQRFCSCTPRLAYQRSRNGQQTMNCFSTLYPSSDSQVAGIFTNEYLTSDRRSGYLSVYGSDPYNYSVMPTCTVSDVAPVNLPMPAFSDVVFRFPSNDYPAETFKCRGTNTSRSGVVEFMVNITNSKPIFLASLNTVISLTQIYYFKTAKVLLVIANVDGTIFNGTDRVPFDYANYKHVGIIAQEVDACAAYSDTVSWTAMCVCPLDTISDALAVASITFLILYPIRLYHGIKAISQNGNGDKMLDQLAKIS